MAAASAQSSAGGAPAAPAREVRIGGGAVVIGLGHPMALMAGPCVIEPDDVMLRI